MEKRMLTDHERFVCIVRWLNVLYAGYVYRVVVPECGACINCPQSDFCPSNSQKRPEELKLGELIAPPCHFQILERFTGPNTVIGEVFPNDLVSDIFPRTMEIPDESSC